MKLYSSLILVTLILTPLAAMRAADTAARKPNIVFIMADDLGYTDVACFGSKYYETPNIDRIRPTSLFVSGFRDSLSCFRTPRISKFFGVCSVSMNSSN